MKIADYLSRVTSNGDVMGKHPGNTVNVIGRGYPEHPVLISKEEIVKRQKSNESIRDVMKALADGEELNPGSSNSDNWRKRSFSSKGEVKELWKHKDRLYIDGEGILRLRFNGGRVNEANPFGVMEKNRIVVPESYRSEIMKLVHRSATAGHMGNNKTWRRARNNFWWPRMKVEAQGAATRIKKNKEVWKSLGDGVTELLGDMSATKVKLLEDGVALEYFTNEVLETPWRELWMLLII